MTKTSCNFRNFKERSFLDKHSRDSIENIYEKIHKPDPKESDQSLEKALRDLLDKLNNNIRDFYLVKRQKDYSQDAAIIRANEVYSEFLQNLIYYITHNVKVRAYQVSLTSIIVDHPNFYYVNHNENKVTIWIDPKKGFSALISAAKHGLTSIVTRLISLATKAYDGNKKSLANFLFHEDAFGYSALIFAAKEGHVEIVRELIVFAKEIFGEDKAALTRVLMRENSEGYSALISAAKEGHVEVVQELIVFAKEICNQDKFNQFIEQKNKYGFTALNATCYAGKLKGHSYYEKIAHILIDEGARITCQNNDRFSPYDNAPKDWKWLRDIKTKEDANNFSYDYEKSNYDNGLFKRSDDKREEERRVGKREIEIITTNEVKRKKY